MIGVPEADLHLYLADREGRFRCFPSGQHIPFDQVRFLFFKKRQSGRNFLTNKLLTRDLSGERRLLRLLGGRIGRAFNGGVSEGQVPLPGVERARVRGSPTVEQGERRHLRLLRRQRRVGRKDQPGIPAPGPAGAEEAGKIPGPMH